MRVPSVHDWLSGGSRRSWRLALVFGVGAMLFGLALGGLSVWFLGSVALAGSTAAALAYNFHFPAALIRLFAFGRTGEKYAERLIGHGAALTDQINHRARLYRAVASETSVLRAGWQLGDQHRLADYLDDVDDVDYARLRVRHPIVIVCAGSLLLIAATIVLAPWALAPIAVTGLMAGVAVKRFADQARSHVLSIRRSGRAGAQMLGASLAAVIPLQAGQEWVHQLTRARRMFDKAVDEQVSLGQAQGFCDFVAGMAGPVAAISVMSAAWLSGSRDHDLLVPAFLAFAWLGLGESAQVIGRAVVADIRRMMASQTETSVAPMDAIGDVAVKTASYESLELMELRRIAPDGRLLGGTVSLLLRKGCPTILTGPSGVGKTSLLKQIAGWLDAGDTISTRGEPLSDDARRRVSLLCLHDAVLLTDTLRINLFAGDKGDDEVWEALSTVELDDRVRAAGGLDAWISEAQFSMGEVRRFNLARAYLSDRSVILLDEPVEHLDGDQGRRILGRLLQRFEDRIVVLSTHTEGLDVPHANRVWL